MSLSTIFQLYHGSQFYWWIIWSLFDAVVGNADNCLNVLFQYLYDLFIDYYTAICF